MFRERDNPECNNKNCKCKYTRYVGRGFKSGEIWECLKCGEIFKVGGNLETL